METTVTSHRHPVLDLMRDEHARLERSFSELLERAYEDDLEALRASFRELERELRAHLELEEVSLLPAFERKDPREAERIRLEHELIRAQLDQLGVALDLKAVRAQAVRELVAMLRRHAQRETAVMYAWADTALAEPKRRPILQWLVARTEQRRAERLDKAS